MNLKNTLIAALLFISSALQALEPSTQAKLDRAKKYLLVSLYAGGSFITVISGSVFIGTNIKACQDRKKRSKSISPAEMLVYGTGTVSCFAVSLYMAKKAYETWKQLKLNE